MKIYGLLLLLSPFYLCAMETEEDGSYIKKASYLIYEGCEQELPVGGRSPGKENKAKFYSATGEFLKEVEKEKDKELENLLDAKAPKPQPTSYAIKYWSVAAGPKIGLFFMVFLDKNGNHLKSYRYDKESKKVTLFIKQKSLKVDPFSEGSIPELDLSIARDTEPVEIEEAPTRQEGYIESFSKKCNVQ